ncbi:hypothetical protein G4Y79_01850 [Phototrophicus methaneseepsis]|uniref:Uncharacterized protein n=1 Tax=Phototrophicus methaneseepsis TaxID=2710758 RepID=A0A7S8IF23_9CHLR|nr:hypothetical protein [Phototrophicus methaneseepsis]QPC83142.1 hypothetical protein G4Y79_01850 [Phototrophicus methaneseepsis]
MKQLLKQIHLPGFDMMGIVLMLWICTLPFIALIVVPLFGPQIGAGIAVALLIAMLLICWGLCIPLVVKLYRNKRRESQRLLE